MLNNTHVEKSGLISLTSKTQ